MTDTIESFVSSETLRPADRSTLEMCAECPRQARFIETGAVLHNTFAMQSGNGVHEAIGRTVTEYVESRGQMDDIKDYLLSELARARPDVQPDVIAGCKASAWAIGRYLDSLHYANIRRWDGGQGEHSGQLAFDLTEFGLRITSEVDLLHDSESPDVMTEVDFKSGHMHWDHHKVRDSFQFQLHALLVHETYPDLKALEVIVWATRMNQRTYRAMFKLDQESIYPIMHRVRAAAAAYYRTRDKAPHDCDAWPVLEKCLACPAARLCDHSKMPTETPEQLVDLLALLEAKTAAIQDIAKRHVNKLGHDIETAAGNRYGYGKPKRKVTPKMAIYSVKTQEPEPESDGTDLLDAYHEKD